MLRVPSKTRVTLVWRRQGEQQLLASSQCWEESRGGKRFLCLSQAGCHPCLEKALGAAASTPPVDWEGRGRETSSCSLPLPQTGVLSLGSRLALCLAALLPSSTDLGGDRVLLVFPVSSPNQELPSLEKGQGVLPQCSPPFCSWRLDVE